MLMRSAAPPRPSGPARRWESREDPPGVLLFSGAVCGGGPTGTSAQTRRHEGTSDLGGGGLSGWGGPDNLGAPPAQATSAVEALTAHGPCGRGPRGHGARRWPGKWVQCQERPCPQGSGRPAARPRLRALWGAGLPLWRPRALRSYICNLPGGLPPSPRFRRAPWGPLWPKAAGLGCGWAGGVPYGLGCGSCPGHRPSVTGTPHTGALALAAGRLGRRGPELPEGQALGRKGCTGGARPSAPCGGSRRAPRSPQPRGALFSPRRPVP